MGWRDSTWLKMFAANPEFDLHDGKTELTPTSCPLTFTWVPWHRTHKCTHMQTWHSTHRCTHTRHSAHRCTHALNRQTNKCNENENMYWSDSVS